MVSALTSMSLLRNPAASMRSWQGMLQSTVARPRSFVRPSGPPDAMVIDASASAAPELSSTVTVRCATAHALAGSGIASIPERASAPHTALDRNHRMRFIRGPREKRSEQLAYSFWRTPGWTVGCQFDERDEHKVTLFDPRVRNL